MRALTDACRGSAENQAPIGAGFPRSPELLYHSKGTSGGSARGYTEPTQVEGSSTLGVRV